MGRRVRCNPRNPSPAFLLPLIAGPRRRHVFHRVLNALRFNTAACDRF